MQEFSYSKNTLFLILAGTVSQILGVILKILLSYRIKEEGMAIYHIALCVYSLFLTPVLCGIPTALTQFISKCKALKRDADILEGIYFSLRVMCILGIMCSLIMFAFCRFFAVSLKEPAAEYAILALSPSVFIVALGTVFKSCFEGYSNMLPCSVSQGIESIAKLIFTCFFTYILGIFSLKYAVLGATLSITSGEAVATFILFLFMTPILKQPKSNMKKSGTAGEIICYALPITAYAIVLSSLNLLENSVIRNSLLATRFYGDSAQKLYFKYSAFTNAFDSVRFFGKLSAKGADWLYGAYFGYTLTIIRFPAGLLRTFFIPFFPLATRRFAEKNSKKLNRGIFKLAGIIVFVSLLLCVSFAVFARQITYLIFGSHAYAQMLVFVSPLLIFVPLCELFSTIWYAYGKTFPPFLFSFISSVISIVMSAVLIRIPYLNILGVAISSVLSAFLEFIMLLLFTKKHLKIKASAR